MRHFEIQFGSELCAQHGKKTSRDHEERQLQRLY